MFQLFNHRSHSPTSESVDRRTNDRVVTVASSVSDKLCLLRQVDLMALAAGRWRNDSCAKELWFQQDGATCHTVRATIDLLKDTLGDRLISRFGPVNWPPRSCDLTPLDYFLWGYVKSLVYADKPQTLDHLEDNIRRVIADIRPQMLEKVIENWTSRLDYIQGSRGSPMPEIIFKISKRSHTAVVAAVAEWSRYQIVAGLITSLTPVPLKTRRVGHRCTLNLSIAQMSSHWCGVVVRRGGASSGVIHVT
ncbi:heat shock 70kDa protein 8 [Trichonephila clavipes]|nr:heat shock 70kDa protein 8 [Trichonephila clavipes]